MKEKNITKFFLLLISIHILGNVWCYHAAKSYFSFRAKKSMQETTGRLFSFTFSKEDLKQVRFLGNKEFVYRGMIYDIKFRKSANNQLTFVAKADPQELFFLKKLTEIIKGNGYKSPNNISFDSSQIFPYIYTSLGINPFYKGITSLLFLRPSPKLTSPLIPILSPPPRWRVHL